MKSRVLALALAILAFFIFVGSPFEQSAEALVGVDDAIITILIAALAACGITFVTSGAWQNTYSYVEGLFNEYAQDAGLSPKQAVYGIDYGRNNLGNIILNNRFVVLVSAFVQYVKLKLSLSDNSSQVIQAGGSYLGQTECLKLPVAFVRYGNQNIDYVVINASGEAYVMNGNNNRVGPRLIFVSEEPVTISLTNNGSTDFLMLNKNTANLGNPNNEMNITDPKLYWGRANEAYYGFSNVSSGYIPPQVDVVDIVSAINNFGTVTELASIGVRTGDIVPPEFSPDYTAGDAAVIDVGADWGATLPDIIIDTIPDAFDDGQVADPTITYGAEETLEQEVIEDGEATISNDASAYQVNGLGDVFPFCIPFDLYNFVSCLAAEPVAPSFTWRFYVPGICDETIEIDFSDFDQAAQLLRTMELLLFCVGLAFVTRKIIRG